ncbi:MAG: zf-TFIIB domain-containing protein [Candidatus Riflebacteria bacterium]|nr:zf-TFIIB domain-containing protein [Candidatus Riflebacteria bacterium]
MNRNEGYTCPACGKALEIVTIADVELEACLNGCGGIWFDAAELFRLDEQEEGLDDPVVLKLLSFNTPRNTDNRDKITCLKCGVKMRRREHREGSGIFVDECYGCGGIWLDGGELRAIRENPVVIRSNEERKRMDAEFSQRIKEEKARQAAEEARKRRARRW